MTEVRVQRQSIYAVIVDADIRVRRQAAYAVIDQTAVAAEVSQASKQVLHTPETDAEVSQVFKQVLYSIGAGPPPPSYRVDGVTTMFGNLDRVLAGNP